MLTQFCDPIYFYIINSVQFLNTQATINQDDEAFIHATECKKCEISYLVISNKSSNINGSLG